jgi:hypothetical protein
MTTLRKNSKSCKQAKNEITSSRLTMNAPRRNNGQFESKYPFGELDLGDYFVLRINKEDENYRKAYNGLRSSAYLYAKRSGDRCKFTCKQIEEGIKVVRIL